MDIKVGSKIHNKFLIEVRNIRTNEIKKGYAENIVLDNFKSSTAVFSDNGAIFFGNSIHFGDGTGTLSSSRTTLFNRLGGKLAVFVEKSFNQVPTPNYCTKKIVITASEYIGKTITEVGVGDVYTNTTVYTHAFIKDSEGNNLVLGPKTSEQEITIYSTVYAIISLEDGVTLYDAPNNPILTSLTGYNWTYVKASREDKIPAIYANGVRGSSAQFVQDGVGKLKSGVSLLDRTQANGKIKSIDFRSSSSAYTAADTISINLETLADNSSSMWGGYTFNKKEIGVGDGTTTVFNLPWNEAVLTKSKAVYVDGVEKTSGVTWATDSITFDTAPLVDAIITGDWYIKYMPKDSNYEIRGQFNIIYGEGTAL